MCALADHKGDRGNVPRHDQIRRRHVLPQRSLVHATASQPGPPYEFLLCIRHRRCRAISPIERLRPRQDIIRPFLMANNEASDKRRQALRDGRTNYADSLSSNPIRFRERGIQGEKASLCQTILSARDTPFGPGSEKSHPKFCRRLNMGSLPRPRAQALILSLRT